MTSVRELNSINMIYLINQMKTIHFRMIAHDLPLLDQLMTMLVRNAGPDSDEWTKVHAVLVKLIAAIPAHLNREVSEVWPLLLRHATEHAPLGAVVEGIEDMVSEHETILDLFSQMRELTRHFRLSDQVGQGTNLVNEKLIALEKTALELIQCENEYYEAYSI